MFLKTYSELFLLVARNITSNDTADDSYCRPETEFLVNLVTPLQKITCKTCEWQVLKRNNHLT